MSLIPSPPPPLPFGGAAYPFPPLPDSTIIFSTQTFCRQTYSTCMAVFRDCLVVVGPIGNGSNQLCETYRNDVCENGIRVGCDSIPRDRPVLAPGMEPEEITFGMPVTTMTDGAITTPVLTVPTMPTPPPNSTRPLPPGFTTPPMMNNPSALPIGTFITTTTTSIPFTNGMGETTRWESMTNTMTMTRDRRGLVFEVSAAGMNVRRKGALLVGLGVFVAVVLV